MMWHHTSRGLYEQHKFLFTLLLALKIDMQRGNVSHAEFLYLLKGGASLDLNSVKPKPYRWMLDVIWLNLVEMSKIDVFSVLLEKVIDSEKEWKSWCDTEVMMMIIMMMMMMIIMMMMMRPRRRRSSPAATRTRWTCSGSCCSSGPGVLTERCPRPGDILKEKTKRQ